MKFLKHFSEESVVALKGLRAGATVRIEETGEICILLGFSPEMDAERRVARAVNLETGENVSYDREEKARLVTLGLKRLEIVRFGELAVGERFSFLKPFDEEYIKAYVGGGEVGAVNLITGQTCFPDLGLLVFHNDEPVFVKFLGVSENE